MIMQTARRYRLLAMYPHGGAIRRIHVIIQCIVHAIVFSMTLKHARAMNSVGRGRAGRAARVCMHMRVHMHAAVQRVVYGRRWQHASLARTWRRKACQKAAAKRLPERDTEAARA